MGNRALIVLDHGEPIANGIYLQWNGGPESIYLFLAYANEKTRGFDDGVYFDVRLAQIIANQFGGNTSIGISPIDMSKLKSEPKIYDPGDNGIFVVTASQDGKNAEVTGRFPYQWLSKPEITEEALEAAGHFYATDSDGLLAQVAHVNNRIFANKQHEDFSASVPDPVKLNTITPGLGRFA